MKPFIFPKEPEPCLGNDLVDLADPRNQGKHREPRFLQRVFTPSEQALILGHPDPDRCLWTLWSAKESAYKALQRHHPGLVFSHRLFEVTLTPDLTAGDVTYGTLRLAMRWTQTPDWIHGVIAPDQGRTLTKVFPLTGPQSQAVRVEARALLAENGYPGLEISGPPPLAIGPAPMARIYLSLSHDGPWGAVLAYVPPKWPGPSETGFS